MTEVSAVRLSAIEFGRASMPLRLLMAAGYQDAAEFLALQIFIDSGLHVPSSEIWMSKTLALMCDAARQAGHYLPGRLRLAEGALDKILLRYGPEWAVMGTDGRPALLLAHHAKAIQAWHDARRLTMQADGDPGPAPHPALIGDATALLAQVTAERDSALARADLEHAAQVRLVEQYDALDAEAVAGKDALDAVRYGAATWKRAAKHWRALAYETHMTTADDMTHDAAIAARDNCYTEHSRALLRVGALEGLLRRWHEYFYEFEQVPGAADLLIDETDAALAGAGKDRK